MKSRVLALKYRPKNFGELVGQQSVSKTLSLALDSNKLSHAYLFSGLRGSGKTSTARIFAKSLLCEKGISSTPCETCSNCLMASENRHMDIVELDAASNRRIEDVRDLIEQTRYAPTQSRFKVFIIDEVHMLTKEAFNALLKTLEEPPEYIKFLLATTDPQKLPATILSRTQHFRFGKIASDQVLAHLKDILEKEQVEYEDEALEIIARAGGGSLRDTLTILDQAIIYGSSKVGLESTVTMLGVLDPKMISHFFELIFASDYQSAAKFIESIENYDIEMILDGILAHLKEMLFAPKPPFSIQNIERFFRIASDSKSLLFYGADSGFVLGLLMLKMIEALVPDSIDEKIVEIEKELAKLPAGNIKVHTEASSVAVAPPAQGSKFDELKQKIYTRSAKLGEVFDKNIEFVSFENSELSWISRAEDEDKKALIADYSVIRLLVEETFGVGTKIVPIRDETPPAKAPTEEPAKTPANDSCMEGALGVATEKPANPQEILEDPFVQKAIEIFNPSNIKIIPKI